MFGKKPQRFCPWLAFTSRAGCGRALCPRAQDLHGALKKAFEFARFDAHARINFFGKIPLRCKIVSWWLRCLVAQIHGCL